MSFLTSVPQSISFFATAEDNAPFRVLVNTEMQEGQENVEIKELNPGGQ